MSTRQHHILVVDDDDILRAGICDLLDLAGYTITAAYDGKDALLKLEALSPPPAVIVSDIRMPRLDGYGFLEEVRKHPEWLSIPFIFLSAKGDKEDIRQGRLRGADDYVPKPFDFQDLLVAIQASLQRHEELHELQEARMMMLKQRILQVLNHEFRTPLSYIIAYADMMASNPAFQQSEELQQYITGITEGGDRLLKLVEKFLTLAELESGFGEKIYEHRRKMVNHLPDLITEALEEVQAKVEEPNITIDITGGDGLPPFLADQEYLKIAVVELIENAIKFSPPGGTHQVGIKMALKNGHICIAIKDSGMGIAPEQQEQLFDMFFQVDRDKLEIGGTGSGLAIVRHVAIIHGGTVRLESKPGEGSLFELAIPVKAS